jgi:kynurenine formamidase
MIDTGLRQHVEREDEGIKPALIANQEARGEVYMKLRLNGVALSLSICLQVTVLSLHPAAGQTREKGPWWPHPIWGPNDQAGASNWITPAKILEAISLVKTGKVYELGHVYERGMPLLGQRSFAMFSVPGAPREGDQLIFNEEFVSAEIGQVGTQFDGLGHVGKRMMMADGTTADVFYNGVTAREMQSRNGLVQLGIEKIKPYITRGLLIDIAGYKGLEILPNAYEVTLSDVRGALAKQGVAESQITPGDALFLNFGWSRLWNDPQRIVANWTRRPGIGPDVVEWIVSRRVSMVGSDASADHANAAVHHELTLKNGIPNLEFMDFEALLADRVYDFMFVFAPLPLKGATGSPGRPLAIR